MNGFNKGFDNFGFVEVSIFYFHYNNIRKNKNKNNYNSVTTKLPSMVVVPVKAVANQ
jgi:hypothetical protein